MATSIFGREKFQFLVIYTAWNEQDFKRTTSFLAVNNLISNTQRYMCMLTNVISYFVPKKSTVLKLLSWKQSFKRLNEEYEIANKKKQALDNLFETGKISQTTRDSFNNEIDAAVADIEKQQKELLSKMQFKMGSLETQIKTLEMLLANYEIQHVVGEIEEETYQRETTVLSTGLETAKQALDVITEAINQIFPPTAPEATAFPPQESEVASPIEAPPVENVPMGPAEVEASPDLSPQEPAITLEETAPTPEQPAAEDVAPVETTHEEITADETAEAAEGAEEIPHESTIPLEDAAPETEQPNLETEETAPLETLEAEQEFSQEPAETLEEAAQVEAPPEENTDEMSIEEATEATDDVNEEPVIITEEAAPEEISAENMDDSPTETVETAEPEVEEEISSDEPLVTVEDAAPETEKLSDETEDVLIIEAPQLVDDGSEAVDEVVPEENPQDAPQEAQPEITAEEAQPEEIVADETTAEEIVADETTAEEIVADETTAENLENSE